MFVKYLLTLTNFTYFIIQAKNNNKQVKTWCLMRFMHCSKTQKQNVHIDDFKIDIDVEICHDMIFICVGDPNLALRLNVQQHAIPIVSQQGKIMVRWLNFTFQRIHILHSLKFMQL